MTVVAAVVVAVVAVVLLVAGVVGVENSVVGGAQGVVGGWRGEMGGVMAGVVDTPLEPRHAAVHSCPVADAGGDVMVSLLTATGVGPSSADCGDPSLIRAHSCRRC